MDKDLRRYFVGIVYSLSGAPFSHLSPPNSGTGKSQFDCIRFVAIKPNSIESERLPDREVRPNLVLVVEACDVLLAPRSDQFNSLRGMSVI